MDNDDTPARAMLDAILALPRQAAGMTSTQIRAILDQLGQLPIMECEFGELTEEARTAVATVASALLSMRDYALERERERLP